MRLLKNRRGFTLIEALIVISIIGIMSAMAVPSVERMMLSRKADAAAGVIGQTIQEAFSLAARQRKPVRVLFQTNPRRVTIRDVATNQDMVVRYFRDKDSPYRLSDWSLTTSDFQVYPSGLASSQMNVVIYVGTHARRIRMSRVGQIRISVP